MSILDKFDRSIRLDKKSTSTVQFKWMDDSFIIIGEGGAPANGVKFIKSMEQDSIRKIVDFFKNAGKAKISWEIYDHDLNFGDLVQKIESENFELVSSTKVMMSLCKESDVIVPQGYSVQEVFDLATVKIVFDEIWGEEYGWVYDNINFIKRNDPSSIKIYAVFFGENPVSVGWARVSIDKQFAGLFGGMTLGEHRGKGLYTALINQRMNQSLESGIPYLYVLAQDSSLNALKRCGFKQYSVCRYYEKELITS